MTGAVKREDPGPGRGAAIAARNAFDDALLALATMTEPFDRAGVKERLLRAIEALYGTLDNGPLALAHHDGLDRARALALEAAAMLAEAGEEAEPTRERLRAVGGSLAAAALAVAQSQHARRAELTGGVLVDRAPPAPRPFRAGRGTPALHAIARPPMFPEIAIGEDAAPAPSGPAIAVRAPKTLDELAAFAKSVASGESFEHVQAQIAEPPGPPAVAPDLPLPYEPAIEEREVLRQIARDTLHDVANLRALRKPNAIETWLDQAPFEERLLAQLDCFAAIGALGLGTVALFAQQEPKDAERAFAAAMALGSIDGPDTIGALVWLVKQSKPEAHAGFAEGLALAPHPGIDDAMRALATSEHAELVVLALDVLWARRAPIGDGLAALVDRAEAAILERCARALASSNESAPAGALPRLVDHATDAVAAAALEALFVRGDEAAPALARRLAKEPTLRGEDAAWLLCLGGAPQDVETLLGRVRAAPSERLVRALGRFGHVAAIPPLLDLLGDEALAGAAAEALDRMTGAGLRETIEEPWPIELSEELLALAARPVPARKVVRPVRDRAAWVEHLRAHPLSGNMKLRAGRPFVARFVVDEMAAAATPPERRAEAARELAIVTGISAPSLVDDWVARQASELDLLATLADVTAYPAGAWPPTARGRKAGSPAVARASSSEPEASAVQSEQSVSQPPKRALPSYLAGGAAAPSAPPERPHVPSGKSSRMTAALPADLAERIARGALPFAKSAAPRQASTAVAPPSPPVDPDTGTLEAQPSPLKRALPFGAPPTAPGPVAPPTAPGPVAPPTALGPAAPPTAPLTLEQYAALCAELAVTKHDAEAIFVRYGLTDLRHRLTVDLAWRERLRQNPAEQARWQALYRHYTSFFAAGPRRP